MKTKLKVLFLSANAPASPRVHVDHDWREIEEAIRSGLERDRFEIETVLGLRTTDLQGALRRARPQIIHFSGHASEQGIELEDRDGVPVSVSGETLAGIFRNQPGHLRCVLLSACESRAVAMAFRDLVDYTIAMRRKISDSAAIAFASAFYRALADGELIPSAYRSGVSQLAMDAPEEADIPELLLRPGLREEVVPQVVPREPVSPVRQGGVSMSHVNATRIVIITGDHNFSS
jgi:hypothetical protein